jgi:hypothetical protein
MPILGWRVHFTRRQLMMRRISRPMLQSLLVDAIAGWQEGRRIEDGVPLLVSSTIAKVKSKLLRLVRRSTLGGRSGTKPACASSTAQPCGYRIRHEDEKNASAISMRILQQR